MAAGRRASASRERTLIPEDQLLQRMVGTTEFPRSGLVREIRTSGLMSGDGKRGGASASVLAPILDSTKCLFLRFGCRTRSYRTLLGISEAIPASAWCPLLRANHQDSGAEILREAPIWTATGPRALSAAEVAEASRRHSEARRGSNPERPSCRNPSQPQKSLRLSLCGRQEE
jgi:hypothetical protein